MANTYTIEALQERFGEDLLIITPEQCEGLKQPFASLDCEFASITMKIEGPASTIAKVVEAIDKERGL